MTDKKQIKGLLDYISLKPGEEAELAPNSEDYVFGMGVGATKEARDLAIIGSIYINIQKLKKLSKNPNGRPKKSILLGIDQKRVFALWFMIKDWSLVKKSNTSNRELILFAQENEYSITTKKLFIGMIAFDGILSSVEGLVMVLILITFLYYLLKGQGVSEVTEEASEEFELLNSFQTIQYLIAGGFALWLGSETLVRGAVSLASLMGVSERVISISIISVGTSIPELSASIIAIIRKEKAISLGNLIGSNVFNILAVMGITSIIQPISVQDPSLITNDFIWMFAISLLVLLMVFVPRDSRLNRFNGVVLLGLYLYFIYGILG